MITERNLHITVSSAVYVAENPQYLPWERKILFLQENRDGELLWNPPGGGMDPHEDPIKTVIREIKEETDLDIHVTGLIGIYTSDSSDIKTSIGFVFSGEILGPKVIRLNTNEGIVSSAFLSYNEVQILLAEGKIFRPSVFNGKAIKDYFTKSGNYHSPLVVRSINDRAY